VLGSPRTGGRAAPASGGNTRDGQMSVTATIERADSFIPDVSYEVTATVDPNARALINERLDAYNRQRAGTWDSVPLDVVIVDSARQVIGGLVGRTSLGVLFVDYVFVPDALRGRGCGSHVLELAECEAIRRGCKTAVLFTMAIQAPAFYENRGYKTFGHIDCDPPGNARVFMQKELHPRASDR
jgi:GNAT superfamily N-acetyltransferase